MSVRPLRAILGGVIGTAAMTVMMYFVAPMMTGQRMDIAAELATMMGAGWRLGMLAHLVNGAVIFPLGYAAVIYRFLPGTPLTRGIGFGVLLWLLAQTVVMPMIGAGFFSMAAGGVKAAMSSLLAHGVYGAILGVIGGEDSDAGAHRTRKDQS